MKGLISPRARGVCVCAHTLILSYGFLARHVLCAVVEAGGCRGILQSASNEDTAVFL